jgi:tetratricopeptide (TPR) repeat protein
MRSALITLLRALGASALVIMAASVSSLYAQSPDYSQDQKPKSQEKKEPQISEGERKLLDKINSAADGTAKLQAAAEYAKKYPKSSMRSNVIKHVAGEIARVQDPAQQVALAENFVTIFAGPGETDLINPLLIDVYNKAGRFDDAFRVAAAQLQKSPNDVALLTQMTIIGVDQARNRNPKFVPQSLKYGALAIELIETNKKPESMEAAAWTEYQTRWLPTLYQYLGLVSLMSNEKEEARARLRKASEINANDPYNYMYLGILANQEYQQLAEEHKKVGSGPLKEESLKVAQAKMDEVIDLYARFVALSEGNAQLKTARDQVMGDLTSYYQYRHGGSKEGLDQLIAKYKKQP